MSVSNSTILKTNTNAKELSLGMKAALPICLGYIPIAMTFGLLAKNAGLSIFSGTLMSALVYAGASQFVAVNMLALNMGWVQIIITTFILNFRHFLMSTALSQKLEKSKPSLLWVAAFGITDESFAMATLQDKDKISPFYLMGLNFSTYISWVLGTSLGFIISGSLPQVVQSGMGIALYVMFIGLLIPSIKKSWTVGVIALLGALFNLLLSMFLTSGWSLVFGAILGAFLATLIFKEV
ncbi:MAG: AzlC family ABC transporter permease [Peptococcales bacterium]|jgi:4-azaleucine resistance transporter AzlC